MSYSVIETPPQIERAEVGDGRLTVHLSDGRSLSVPLGWYPRLAFATPEELAVVETEGEDLEWPLLNETIPLRALLEGRPSQEGARSLARWKALMERRRAQIARGEEPEPHYPTLPLPEGWEAEP